MVLCVWAAWSIVVRCEGSVEIGGIFFEWKFWEEGALESVSDACLPSFDETK